MLAGQYLVQAISLIRIPFQGSPFPTRAAVRLNFGVSRLITQPQHLPDHRWAVSPRSRSFRKKDGKHSPHGHREEGLQHRRVRSRRLQMPGDLVNGC